MAGSLTILPDLPPAPTPIGLIAGGGRLPIKIAEGLRSSGHPIHALGFINQFDPALPALCTTFQQVGIMRVGAWCRLLRRARVQHAIMVGRVDKAKLMYDPWRLFRHLPDWRTCMAWYKHLRHDRRSHAVLGAIADELSKSGIHLLDSTAPIPDQMATPGVMGHHHPDSDQRADIGFGWPLLSEILRLDIGQAIAVRELDVIAVEAIEGTDRMIERAGNLCKRTGWILCKGARAGHDRRSDVPTVGVKTIENLHAAGGRCIALAAGDVIMIDKPQVLEVADRLGVAVVGVPAAQA